MQKVAWIIVVVVTSGVGAYLLVGSYGDRRARSWLEEHFVIMDEQMSSLAEHLRQFKKSHGRYPSTDEGPGVLDNFAAQMKITMFRDRFRYRANDFFSLEGYMGHSDPFWSVACQRVRDYRIKEGHPPRTLEEMIRADILRDWGQCIMTDEEKLSWFKDMGAEAVERELAIGQDDVVFLIGPAGVLTPWQMPYVYENRHDMPGTLFADSPAENYGAGRYSVKIDDGVYVWSVVAKEYSDEYRVSWFKYVTSLCAGAGLLILAVGLIWRKVRGRARIPAAVGLVIGAVAGPILIFWMIALTTPYGHLRPIFDDRDPAMVSRRRELLDKYRAAGTISDETYVKNIESLGLKPTERSTTRPDEGE